MDANGKVYLVGAGPGNLAYLTLQGRRLLAQADVLVYDALVNPEVLELLPEGCVPFDVGKRSRASASMGFPNRTPRHLRSWSTFRHGSNVTTRRFSHAR